MNNNYLDHIRNEIITTEAKVKVREYKNNLDKLTRNYNISKEIAESGKQYGKGIVKKYASILTKEFGKGYKVAELRIMRAFYELIQKCAPVERVLTWSHFIT